MDQKHLLRLGDRGWLGARAQAEKGGIHQRDLASYTDILNPVLL